MADVPSFVKRIPVIGHLFDDSPQARTYRSLESIRRRASFWHYPMRAFFRAVAKTQHSEIEAIGLENIPPDGAVFLVGNHPNSYLDFLNLSTVVRHPIATAAKDTITNTPIVGKILKDYALLVPVSRAQDRDDTGISEEERVKANEQMVQEAVELLVHGRLFNIYAEGRSTDSRRLNKIKLGFMMLAIEAERQFNFNLNLRIVPYGYFYDRINKFQSGVCLIFGKPFKIKNLVELPENFISLSDRERQSVEKKILSAGKQRLQGDIEELIISIQDPKLVSLIDGVTAIYVLSPVKYMGTYENVKEKYVLCKTISESIQKASESDRGKLALDGLKADLKNYQTKLSDAGLPDAVVRREYTWTSTGYHLRVLAFGILVFPLILYGYLANFLPRQVGRFMRYFVIDVKKKPQVDGDEASVLAAAVAALVTYPLFGIGFYQLLARFFHPWFVKFLEGSASLNGMVPYVQTHNVILPLAGTFFLIYLMARLWRFSLLHGRRMKSAFRFAGDAMLSFFLSGRLRDLKESRARLIDRMDFIIGDYH